MRKVFFILFPIYAFSGIIDCAAILRYAEKGESEEIAKCFDQTATLSISQGNSVLNDLSKKIKAKVNEVELKSLQEVLLDIIEAQEAPNRSKEMVEDFFNDIFYRSLSKAPSRSEKVSFLRKPLIVSTNFQFLSLSFLPKSEVADGVVVGAVETLAGALLWLSPFRPLGITLMADGIRRMLDALPEDGSHFDPAIN